MVQCPPVYLSHLSIAATACGGFAAGCPAGRQYRSIAAMAPRSDQQQMRGLSCLQPLQMADHKLVIYTTVYFATLCVFSVLSHSFLMCMFMCDCVCFSRLIAHIYLEIICCSQLMGSCLHFVALRPVQCESLLLRPVQCESLLFVIAVNVQF